MPRNPFLDRYASFLNRRIILARPLRVVFDASDGTAGLVARKLKARNFSSYLIHGKPDGNFPAHGPNQLVPGALAALQKEVKKRRADFGVALDGDGDRAIFVDERGAVVPTYVLACLCASVEKPPLVTDLLLFESVARARRLSRREIFRAKIGSFFIKPAMRRHHASLGVEYSGHYYFREFGYADSGIYAAIMAMNALSRLNEPFSRYVAKLPVFAVETFSVPAAHSAELLKRVMTRWRPRAKRVERFEGITFNFSDWWFNVRPSGTEPIVRFHIEARSVREAVRHASTLEREARTLQKTI